MRVVVLGAGIMGSGIGQLAAMAGHQTGIRDVDEAALSRGAKAVRASLDKLTEKGRLEPEEADAAWSRLELTRDLDVVADADVVIEAVPEILDLKREVLAEVAERAKPGVLLGTNTSQLSITSIGARLSDSLSARLIGMHFFNPPVLMSLVELIRGLQTSDATLEEARSFAEGLGREVVVCQKDSPGFITSRAYAILRLECLRMLEEGVATADDIDRALRLGFNFPMGPLELGDFNGLDTYLHALEALSVAFGERFRPTVGLRSMVEAGHLGRKSGRGFYDYSKQSL
jgi:3-hydroxybutyryl-CoA dehydrogenase